MGDMTRQDELLRTVHERLANREFARHFDLINEAGQRPIVAALREDTMISLYDRVLAIGGAANVVVPMFDGLIVFRMTGGPSSATARPKSKKPMIDGDTTVGVMLQRLADDGGSMTYLVCRPKQTVGDSGTVDSPRVLELV